MSETVVCTQPTPVVARAGATSRFRERRGWHDQCSIRIPMLAVDESALARSVLRELDVGVLVSTTEVDRILLSNPAADRMLAHLDDGEEVPQVLRETVAEVLARRAAPGGFPPAVPMRGKSGACLFVRAKKLPDCAAALVVISGD